MLKAMPWRRFLAEGGENGTRSILNRENRALISYGLPDRHLHERRLIATRLKAALIRAIQGLRRDRKRTCKYRLGSSPSLHSPSL